MSKYRAKRTEVDGISFDSMAEARRYGELQLLARAGVIRDLELQPVYPLTINGQKVGRYTADFRYQDIDRGETVIEDVKGGNATKSEAYRLRKKVVEAIHGIRITEVQA